MYNPMPGVADAANVFTENEQAREEQEAPSRAERRENIHSLTKRLYAEPVSLVTVRGNTFRVQAVNDRGLLDARIDELRESIRPTEKLIGELKREKGRMDGMFIAAWQQGGTRTSDGSLVVETNPERRSWSNDRVERACAALGVSFDEFVSAAAFGTKATVKIFR